jgi:hypothetical protein
VRVSFDVGAARVPCFFLLLQQGVRIRRRVGCPLEAFLREEIGASPETIGRIQSIFLDGKPVDDIAAALVLDGSTLALSAALPGLVGATLRRGGTYSSFRSGITHREGQGTCTPGTGWVTVKLFNLIMDELGPGLLREGALVRASDLIGLLPELPEDLWQECGRITLDGKPVDRDALLGAPCLRGEDRVLLSVAPGPPCR